MIKLKLKLKKNPWQFLLIFWTVDPFATKLDSMAHHRRWFKVKDAMKVQIYVSDWVRIYSEPLNLPLPNLVWWCVIMDQSVLQKDWFAVFMVKVTVRAHIIKYVCFYHISTQQLILFTAKFQLDGTSSWARVSYRKMWLFCSRSRSQRRF